MAKQSQNLDFGGQVKPTNVPNAVNPGDVPNLGQLGDLALQDSIGSGGIRATNFSNLIGNPNFIDDDQWDLTSGTSIVTDATSAVGERLMRYTANNGSNNIVRANAVDGQFTYLPVQNGDIYYGGMWVRIDPTVTPVTGTNLLRLRLLGFDAAGSSYQYNIVLIRTTDNLADGNWHFIDGREILDEAGLIEARVEVVFFACSVGQMDVTGIKVSRSPNAIEFADSTFDDRVIQDGSINLVKLSSSALVSLKGKAFRPTDYGTLGVGNDSVVVNATIAAYKASAVGSAHYEGYLDFKGLYFEVTTPINLTSFREADYQKVEVDARGATFFGKTTGKTVIDIANTRNLTWYGGTIIGDASNLPRSGIQVGRDSTKLTANDNHFIDIQVKGEFSLACMYNYASEGLTVNTSIFENDYDNANAFALVQDGLHVYGIVSDFVTPVNQVFDTVGKTNTAACVASFNESMFNNCKFFKRNSGSTIYMSRSSTMKFYNCYGVSWDKNLIEMYFDIASSHEGFQWIQSHAETLDKDPGIQSLIYMYGNGACTLANTIMDDHTVHAEVAIFEAGSDVNSVYFKNLKVDIASINPNVSPEFVFPATKAWEGSGQLSILDTNMDLEDMDDFNGVWIRDENSVAPLPTHLTGLTVRDRTHTWVMMGEYADDVSAVSDGLSEHMQYKTPTGDVRIIPPTAQQRQASYTDAEMLAITSPQTGEEVYNSDNDGLWMYDGSDWVPSGGNLPYLQLSQTSVKTYSKSASGTLTDGDWSELGRLVITASGKQALVSGKVWGSFNRDTASMDFNVYARTNGDGSLNTVIDYTTIDSISTMDLELGVFVNDATNLEAVVCVRNVGSNLQNLNAKFDVLTRGAFDYWVNEPSSFAVFTPTGYTLTNNAPEEISERSIQLTTAQMQNHVPKAGTTRFNTDLGCFLTSDGVSWTNNGGIAIGTTAQRPENVYVGYRYYDTTISQGLKWGGNAWIIIATGESLLGSYSFDSIPGLPTPTQAQVGTATLPAGWSASDTAVYTTDSGSTKTPNHSASGGSYSKDQTFHLQKSSGHIQRTATATTLNAEDSGLPSDRTAQWDFLYDDVLWYQPTGATYSLRKITMNANGTIASDVEVFNMTELNSQFGWSCDRMYVGGPGEGIMVGGPQIGNNKQFATVHAYLNGVCYIAAYNITDDVWCTQTQTANVQATYDEFDFGGMSELGDSFAIKSRPQSTNFSVDFFFYPISVNGVGSVVFAQDPDDIVGHSWGAVANINGTPVSVWMSPYGSTMRVFRMDTGAKACPDYTVAGDWGNYGHGGMIKYTDWAYLTGAGGIATAFKWDGSVGCALGTGGFIDVDTSLSTLSISGILLSNLSAPVKVDYTHTDDTLRERTYSD